MRRFMLPTGLLLALVLALPAIGEASPFTRIIVYGDSLSDNANV